MRPGRVFDTAVLAGAVLLLAGCGRGGEGEAPQAAGLVEAPLQIATTADERLGMAPPANLPKYAPIPAGAFIVAAEGAPEGKGGTVEFSVPDTTTQVLDFYRKAARAGGLAVQEQAEGDRQVITAKGAAGSVQVEVSAAPGTASFVRLTYA